MAGSFKLLAGHPALDLVNTLDDRCHPRGSVELIASYEDFVRFAVESRVVRDSQARSLLRRIDNAAAERALRSVRTLRETMERIFSAVAEERTVAVADLAMLNRRLAETVTHRKLEGRSRSFVWTWAGLEQNAVGPLWPIVFAAGELLASSDRQYVRHCACETCRWFFLDTSKNHSRRWCDMKVCGDRTKARTYYQRRMGRV
jgi:predicted RNA-binding Zn ribbon-like protein